jgi:hypothetical protein
MARRFDLDLDRAQPFLEMFHRPQVVIEHGGWPFGSGVSVQGVPIDPNTQLPVTDPSIEVEQIIWVDFQLSGIGVSAFTLLRRSVVGVIHARLRPHLP